VWHFLERDFWPLPPLHFSGLGVRRPSAHVPRVSAERSSLPGILVLGRGCTTDSAGEKQRSRSGWRALGPLNSV